MKKRFILPPIGLAILGSVWFSVWRPQPSNALAQDAQNYTAPKVADARHPIDTFVVDLAAGGSKSDILAHLPTTIYPEDKVSFALDPAFGLGTIVYVERAMPITVQDGKVTVQARTWANTVGELLNQINRPLGDLDKANVANGDLLIAKEVITINRVAKTKVTTTQAEPFSVLNQNDATMWKGDSKVTQAGANGIRTIIYEVTRQDGVEVSRRVVSNSVTTAPTGQIVHVGTKPRITVPCAGYDNTVLVAAMKNGVDPNSLCTRLIMESNGHANSVASAGYSGLFQYEAGFWKSVSAKAGYPGASIFDATAQINVTAWAWANGFRSRWP